jgi:DNA-directed RNA polymerase subunit M/transcription elongation factor TFIIS
MICDKCGIAMHQVEKDTSSGREIREYECPKCGYSDWEDCGKALWQILHDAREEDEAAKANLASANPPDSHPEPSKPERRSASSKWGRLLNVLAWFHKKKQ